MRYRHFIEGSKKPGLHRCIGILISMLLFSSSVYAENPPVEIATFQTDVRSHGIDVDPVTCRIYQSALAGQEIKVWNECDYSAPAVSIPIKDENGILQNTHGVAVDTSTHWAFSSNFGSDSVSAIPPNLNSDEVITVYVDRKPHEVAVNPFTHRVYITNQGDNKVTVLDGDPSSVATFMEEVVDGGITVGSGPAGIAINPNTNNGFGTIYVVNTSNNTVSVINGEDNAVIETIHLCYPYSTDPDSTSCPPSEDKKTSVYFPQIPHMAAYLETPNRVYINHMDGVVEVIDSSTNTLLPDFINLQDYYPDDPNSITVYSVKIGANNYNDHVYVTHKKIDAISVIDGSDLSFIGSVPMGNAGDPLRCDQGGPVAVVANPYNNRVYVTNDSGGKNQPKELNSITALGYFCSDDPDQNCMFFDDFNDGTADEWTPVSGTWAVENGEYSEESISNFTPAFSLTDLTTRNMIIEVKGNDQGRSSIPGAGGWKNFFIIFAYDEANQTAYWAGARVGGNHWAIEQIDINGNKTLLAHTHETINKNTWYNLKVVIEGDTVTLYADDVKKVSYTFTEGMPSGRVGLGGVKNHAHFDDFRITTCQTCGTGWPYRQAITIDSSMAPTDQANFPVLIKLTDPANPVFANAQADGDDIFFTSDNGARLDHEIERYDNLGGELVAWVRIPLLSSTTDTIIYLYYGNGSASNQENPECVWVNKFNMVQHLQEAPDDGEPEAGHLDSSNLNNGTPHNFQDGGGGTTDAEGQIDGADYFAGDNDYIEVPNSGSLNFGTTDSFTISFWMNILDNSGAQWIIDKYDPDVQYGQGYHATLKADGTIRWMIHDTTKPGGVWPLDLISNTVLNAGNWHMVTFVRDADTKIAYLYVNGGSEITSVDDNTTVTSANDLPLQIGRRRNFETKYYAGSLDEIRISKAARSEDWIAASFNNQDNPAAFLTFGQEEN